MAMHKKQVTNVCESSKCVTPANINETVKESELADLEKIMDSFESEERVIGTIIKCDTDNLHGVSDSPPRITLGNMTVVNDNCNVTSDSVVQTNTIMTETPTKDHNDKIIQNTEAESTSPCELAGVTIKINSNTEPTNINADMEEQRKLAGVTVNTTVSIDIPNMTDLLTKNTQELEGVNTHHAQKHIPGKPVTPSNPTITPSNAVANSPHDATTLPLEETMAPIGTIHAAPNCTPDDVPEDGPVLPDLVVKKSQNENTVVEQAISQEVITNTSVTPNNTGEFDFPPISSNEENVNRNGLPAMLDSCEKESQLTEEEGDVVNALLSLSRSLPSNGEDDTELNENSELMPIGKPTLDVAPVPIRLSREDVQAEVSRLNLHESKNDVSTPQCTTTTTTTMMTIIMDKFGAVLSTCNAESPGMPLASPTRKLHKNQAMTLLALLTATSG